MKKKFIGDYNNDVSIYKAAGIGIAVSTACNAALDVTDFVTVSNGEHAIAKTIYNLESGKHILQKDKTIYNLFVLDLSVIPNI